MNLNRRYSWIAVPTLLFSACYAQESLHTTVPAPATPIVAQLTDTGSIAMSNTIGPAAVEVEGIVASADANAWNLELQRVHHRGGSSVAWNRELVSFPRSAFTNVSVKRLDRTRSWMAGGLVVAGAFVLARALGVASGGEIPTKGGPIAPPD